MSYIDLLESVTVDELPILIPAINLVCHWEREQESELLSLKLLVEGPGGKLIREETLPPLTFQELRYRLRIQIAGAKFEQEGEHKFRLMCQEKGEWKQATVLALSVSKRHREAEKRAESKPPS